MKRSDLLIAGLLLFIFSSGANAQTKTGYDFFAGKWNVTVSGAPQGNADIIVNFKRIDDVVSASIIDSSGNDLYKVTKTEIDKDQAVITFIGSQSDDVPLTLRKKDETSITGDIMGMFGVEGKRLNKNK